MTVAEEVSRRVAPTTTVVDDDAVGLDAARRAVDEDHRKAGADVRGKMGVVLRRRHEDEPVDPPADEVGDECPLPIGLLVEARREDDTVARAGGVLEGAQQARGEAVADVLEQRADHPGPAVAAAQVAGREVVPVVQTVSCTGHLVAQLARDTVLAVDHPRNRLEAHTGQSRHVPHGRPPRSGEIRLRV